MNAPPTRALVTGASGFIGAHLVRRLVAEGFEVSVLTRTGSDLHSLDPVKGSLHVIEHDGVTESLIDTLGGASPDIVFHLASLFVAEHRPEQVTNLVDSNIRLGAQLLEAMAVNGCRLLVNAGTSWQHFGESGDRFVCLYAATKQAFEAILDFYIDAHEFRSVHLRLFDTYGPGDRRPKLFSLLRRAAESGATLDMSAGEQLIDLVYIDDVVEAFLMAGNRLLRRESSAREEFAVSSGAPMSLRRLVAAYARISGVPLNVRWGARPYRRREVMVPWTGGIPVPGWSPKMTLEEGVGRMTAYHAVCEVR